MAPPPPPQSQATITTKKPSPPSSSPSPPSLSPVAFQPSRVRQAFLPDEFTSFCETCQKRAFLKTGHVPSVGMRVELMLFLHRNDNDNGGACAGSDNDIVAGENTISGNIGDNTHNEARQIMLPFRLSGQVVEVRPAPTWNNKTIIKGGGDGANKTVGSIGGEHHRVSAATDGAAAIDYSRESSSSSSSLLTGKKRSLSFDNIHKYPSCCRRVSTDDSAKESEEEMVIDRSNCKHDGMMVSEKDQQQQQHCNNGGDCADDNDDVLLESISMDEEENADNSRTSTAAAAAAATTTASICMEEHSTYWRPSTSATDIGPRGGSLDLVDILSWMSMQQQKQKMHGELDELGGEKKVTHSSGDKQSSTANHCSIDSRGKEKEDEVTDGNEQRAEPAPQLLKLWESSTCQVKEQISKMVIGKLGVRHGQELVCEGRLNFDYDSRRGSENGPWSDNIPFDGRDIWQFVLIADDSKECIWHADPHSFVNLGRKHRARCWPWSEDHVLPFERSGVDAPVYGPGPNGALSVHHCIGPFGCDVDDHQHSYQAMAA